MVGTYEPIPLGAISSRDLMGLKFVQIGLTFSSYC
jgi:hypothetical protein